MPESILVPGPVDLFDRMRRHWTENTGGIADELADDAVIEIPFATEGTPRRLQGQEAVRRFTGPQQAAFARQYRLEEIRDVVIHETADPEVIVVEYELTGTVVATGHRASSSFIGVLRARDGKIVLWREYQNPLVMAEVAERLRNG
ncbi:nuclear transport factor 2 family protein [Streptosporangium sp. NPDC050855]|uniref:nuclear transport factor 2 family protein n=1 Tax=Streptosporangium sp. NPDC050855 TaxID=3366194 RepID=UPI00378EDFB7